MFDVSDMTWDASNWRWLGGDLRLRVTKLNARVGVGGTHSYVGNVVAMMGAKRRFLLQRSWVVNGHSISDTLSGHGDCQSQELRQQNPEGREESGVPHNSVVAMGVPVCTEQCFANVVGSLKAKGRGGGGALSSTCSAASEIFRIAAIMNALVLIGVAVGFVLLRIEASVEESE
ncbi:hypothetical protein AAG906_031134 [Vitis piasezkii]